MARSVHPVLNGLYNEPRVRRTRDAAARTIAQCRIYRAPCLRRSGENARARGLFSRASLTRNVTLLNLEPSLFFPFLSVELIFRCLDTFTVKWVTSKSKQKSWRETVEDAEWDKGTIKSLAEHVQLIKCSYHQIGLNEREGNTSEFILKSVIPQTPIWRLITSVLKTKSDWRYY